MCITSFLPFSFKSQLYFYPNCALLYALPLLRFSLIFSSLSSGFPSSFASLALLPALDLPKPSSLVLPFSPYFHKLI